jgi:cysteinyl-tRNA synthetase
MIRSILGSEIDIHTGGMDHIPVHHNNEIAQSECANGKPLARYWLHEAMITIEGEKISKSLGNVVLLSDIVERGYNPLALRYFYLQASFRTPVSFSWEALKASNNALTGLYKVAADVLMESSGKPKVSATEREFIALVRDDLSTAPALALLWSVLKEDDLSPEEKQSLLIAADSIFGLSLLQPPVPEVVIVPDDVKALIEERDAAREQKDYARSDELRIHIENRGYAVEDSPTGTKVSVQAQ